MQIKERRLMTLGAAQPTAVAAIRNVVLLGPSGSGKTTLAERLIVLSGMALDPGSVADGTSILDADPMARLQMRSVELTVASIQFQGVLVNLIDTPGYVDFLGEVRAGLRAADAALFVVSAVDGIDAATRALWDECEAINMPRGVVVTNLDRDESDFDEAVAVCHRMFTGGRDVLPLHLPVLDDDGSFVGVLDLISNRIHEWSSSAHQERDADPEHLDMTSTARAELLDGIAAESDDEQLLQALIDGDAVDTTLLDNDLVQAINRGHFHPAQAFSGANGIGGELILDLIVRAFPSPSDRVMPLITTARGLPIEPLTAQSEGPLCAEVVKTRTDPRLGRVSIVRVFSGRLPADVQLHVAGHFSRRPERHDHDLTEHDDTLNLAVGSVLRTIDTAAAGSIVTVTGLSRAETGDTISYTSMPLIVEPWLMPEANLPIALTVSDIADEQRLRVTLEHLIAEDPSLKLTELEGQFTLWCLGQAHAEVAIGHLRERFGLEVSAEELRISMRESFSSPATGVGEVADGNGKVAARCAVAIASLEAGTGIAIVNDSDQLSAAALAAAERGIRRQLAQGSLAGYPTTDVRVSIADVTTEETASEHDIEAAAARAVTAAESQAGKHLLEAHEQVTITTPEEFVISITGDLRSKGATIIGTESHADGTVTLTATAPARELFRFAIDIRSLTHGAGSFVRESAGFARVPKSSTLQLLPLLD